MTQLNIEIYLSNVFFHIITFIVMAAFGSRKSISGKKNVFRCLATLEYVLRKINSDVWFVQTFYGKWLPFYGKSFPVFVFVKHFTENEIHFLQKIISHVWFVDHFTENNNFKHLHYLNKPVTVQKYSSKFKHLHCLNTSVTVQKHSSTSTLKLIIWIYP